MTSRISAVFAVPLAVCIVFATRGAATACPMCSRPDHPRSLRSDGSGRRPEPGPRTPLRAIPRELLGHEVVCPVSGTLFVVTEHTATSEHGANLQYYCCECCLKKDKRTPEAEVAPEESQHH